MAYRFEWDEDRAKSNWIKHGVSFDESTTVFDDSLARVFDDEVHSTDERREIIIGHSISNRLLVVLSNGQMREFALSAHVYIRRRSGKLMKKTSTTKSRRKRLEDMQPEYDFDYKKAKPNRFGGRIAKDRLVVLLDPEVSKVFTDSESVNAVLRALITALPKSPKREARK